MAMIPEISTVSTVIFPVFTIAWTALGIGAGIVANLWGSSKQSEAAKKSRDIDAQRLKFEQDLTLQLLEEGRPLREAQQLAATQAINLLSGDVLREPGTSPEFLRAEESGTRRIMSNLAQYGLVDSSVTGEAVGEFSSNLLAKDIASLTGERFRLAGFGGDLTGQGIGAAGLASGTSGRLSTSTLTSGVSQALPLGDLGELAFSYGLNNLSSDGGPSIGTGTYGGYTSYGSISPTTGGGGYSGPFDLTGGR